MVDHENWEAFSSTESRVSLLLVVIPRGQGIGVDSDNGGVFFALKTRGSCVSPAQTRATFRRAVAQGIASTAWSQFLHKARMGPKSSLEEMPGLQKICSNRMSITTDGKGGGEREKEGRAQV